VTAATVPDAFPTKQPRGLALLFFTEMWERFSYYGMRALLILFLIDTTTGGFGWTQEKASQLYGWYTGLVYLTPIIGGWLADRYLGTARALVIGGIVIALGHFTMAADTRVTFFLGLVLIIVGTGFFKANVSTLVGQLYRDHDPRRDAGFTIFYIGINSGAFLGPLVCGWLAANPKYGWSWGFGAAGVGMTLGVICFMLLRKRYLGDTGMVPMGQMRRADGGKASVEPLTKEEKDRVLAIFIVVFFVAFFWLAFEQAGSSLNVFAQQKTQRVVGGWLGRVLPNGEIPAAWFQSVNAFFIVTLAPLFALLWKKMGSRQPSTPVKMAWGLCFLGLGFLVIVLGARVSDLGGLASPGFLISLYFLHTCGELLVSPVGLSFVTKVAPVKIASMMMGVWFLSNFTANLAGGYLAGTVQKVARGEVFTLLGGQADFFLIFVVTSFAACALLFTLMPTLKRLIHGRG
jgi:proton-dependent oligopeptide transporter, POT family